MLTKEKIIKRIEKLNNYRVKVIEIKGEEKDFINIYKAYVKNQGYCKNATRNMATYSKIDNTLANVLVNKIIFKWL